MPTTMRLIAQAYAEKGWSCIPVRAHDKIPAISWRKFQQRRPLPEELDEFFDQDNDINIGIVTGAISNLAVLDLDSPAALRYALAYDEGRGLGEAVTPLVKTSKGWHVYYQYPGNLRNVQADPTWPGIDLRAEGGFVVAPPSIHASGFQYTWELDGDPVPMLPWMTGNRRRARRDNKIVATEGLAPPVASPATHGRRNTQLTQLAGSLISMRTPLPDVLGLCLAWNTRNADPLTEEEVRKTVASIAATNERRHGKEYTFGGTT